MQKGTQNWVPFCIGTTQTKKAENLNNSVTFSLKKSKF